MGKSKHNKKDKLSRDQATALIMGVFGRNPKKILNFKQVSSQLFISDKFGRSVISKTLDEMVRSKALEQVAPGRYRLLSRAGYRTGTLDMTQHGYAFLISEDEGDDVFIARNNLKTALDRDLVKVIVYPKKKQSTRIEGEVIEILERSRNTFVGTVEVSREYAFLLPDSRKMPFDIFIPKGSWEVLNMDRKPLRRSLTGPKK